MAGTNVDIIINGIKARLLQGEDGGGYKRRTIRKEIQNQLLSQAENPTLRNREDGVALYQTSWAGGTRWWKPLITPDDLASYFQSNNLDVWSEPGKVVPMNKPTVETTGSANLHDRMVGASPGFNQLYMIGTTDDTTENFLDIYQFTGGSAWTRYTFVDSGIPSTHEPVAMTFDPNDSYFYVVAIDPNDNDGASVLCRFNLDTDDSDASWITGFNSFYGANIFVQNQNLMIWNGEELFTVNKAAPSLTTVFDDGFGPDYLFGGVIQSPLARATPEGIYYVKNSPQGSQTLSRVFRVRRDEAGNWLGHPIATMPVGFTSMGIITHMGQLIISGTPNLSGISLGSPTVELYFVGEGGMGSLGSILGDRDEVDEFPFRLIGTSGSFLYIAGEKRLWVYDAIRGGIHTVWEWPDVSLEVGDNFTMFETVTLSASARLFVTSETSFIHTISDDTPDTVTDFGDDETHYTLESNYFDGNLPMEEKQITKVAILRDKDDGGSAWSVQISADDGAYTDVLLHSGSTNYQEISPANIKGFQFRYRLIYQTKDSARSAMRALLVTMTSGDMITEWDLVLDGDELINLDGQRQNPKAFYDSMVTLANEKSIINLIDNYRDHERTTSDAITGFRVKVVAVEIMKDVPGESAVRLVLRQA